MKPNINSEIKSAFSVLTVFFSFFLLQYTDFSAHQSSSSSHPAEGQLTANFDITYWTIHCSTPGKEKKIFHFYKTSRPALEPNQLPFVPGCKAGEA